MGGKDSPPPQCTSASPMQSPKMYGGHRSQRSNTFVARPSPIEYVPRNKGAINVDLKLPCESKSQTLPREKPSQPQVSSPTSPRGDGSYSPIRAYMECFQPQTLKCALVGDSGVGKTSMLMAYTVEKFPETHAPTIFDKFSTSLSVYGKRVSITLCDTAGQDDFSHLRPLCYPDVDVAIVCYSIANPDSYENVKTKWIKEVRRHCPGVPVVLVGTQVDKREDPVTLKELKSKGKRPMSRSDGNKLLSQIKATCYVECSALTQLNIKNAFDEAIAAALELSSSSGKRSTQCMKPGCTIL